MSQATRMLNAESMVIEEPMSSKVVRGWRTIRIAVGTLLLVAAALKLRDASWEPMGSTAFLSPGLGQILVIAAEGGLAAWLLGGVAEKASWFAALSFFAALATASFYAWASGQRSCGCFGRQLTVSPAYTFFLDLGVCAALMYRRPVAKNSSTAPRRSVAQLLSVAAGAGMVLTAVLGAVAWGTDKGLKEALWLLRGERLTVEPAITDMGSVEAGGIKVFTVQVANHTDQPIRLVGGTTTCARAIKAKFPIVVPAHSFTPVTVVVRVPAAEGLLSQDFWVYAAEDTVYRVVGAYRGHVERPQ